MDKKKFDDVMSNVRLGVDIVIAVGVGGIVTTAAKKYAPSAMGPIRKACTAIGTFFLADMVASKTATFANNEIRDCAKEILDAKEQIEEIVRNADEAESNVIEMEVAE